MKNMIQLPLLAIFLLSLTISGCSGSKVSIDNYKSISPNLDLFSYFEGSTRGWGMFHDRKGTLKRQFVVDIKGYKNADGALVLEEDFVWNDGEKSRRVWTIKQSDNNNYIGTADDVMGEARGISAGNSLNWSYDLNLPVGDKTYVVHFDDWMFLQPDGVMLNRAKMSKFGFGLGEVFISFKKL